MRIANNTTTAQPLTNGVILPSGAVADIDDEVGQDAIDRGAASLVDHTDHDPAVVLDLTTPEPPASEPAEPDEAPAPELEGAQ